MNRTLLLSTTLFVMALSGTAAFAAPPVLTDDMQAVGGALPSNLLTPRAKAAPVAVVAVAAPAAASPAAPVVAVAAVAAPAAAPAPVVRPAAASSNNAIFAAPWTKQAPDFAPGGFPSEAGESMSTPSLQTNAGNSSGAVAPPAPGKDAQAMALDAALSNLLPSPSAVTAVRQAGRATERAENAPIGETPRPVTRRVAVTLQPGEQPPVIALSFGAVSTLTFADVTGQPWNIKSVTVDDSAYGVTAVSSKDKTNIVSVFPKEHFTEGRNLVVTLDEFPMPVIFTLQTGNSKTVDYRADVQVMKRGPNARADFVQNNLSPTEDTTMQAFIDGVAPTGARKMESSSSDVEAWRFKGTMYVRTAMKVVSPAPTRVSSSNLSGVTVYAMPDTPDVIVSQDGQLASVRLGR